MASVAAAIAALVASTAAHADPAVADVAQSPEGTPAVVLPVALVHEDAARRAEDREAEQILQTLDALLTDTAQDLGLTLDLTHRTGAAPAETDLAEQARAMDRMIVAPSVDRTRGGIDLRIVLARPGARTLLARVERVARGDLDVRAAVMLRDLITEAQRGFPRGFAAERGPAAAHGGAVMATPPRSAGRAALSVSSTVFGAFVGYSVLRSSGSDDPRLLYPLLAVGAGVGLGGSTIIAEEWDVGAGDAWFLTSGAFWPALAGHLIYEGRFADHATAQDERWSFGLVGGTAGLSIATLGLALHGMSEGGAVIAHSGGGLGLVFGGLAELGARGDIYSTPFTGLGYGAGFGWLAGAAVAMHVHVTPARVLALDLGAVLGGLGGAALGSPLVFDKPTKDEQRAWLGVTAGSALIGAGIAWYATRESPPGPLAVGGSPEVGVLGESVIGERRAPIYGAGWRGSW